MHNLGLDEVFFATQFVKDLKMELRAGVQSQAPDTVKRVVMLAKVQQQLQKSKKFAKSKSYTAFKPPMVVSKTDSRSSSSASSLWKE